MTVYHSIHDVSLPSQGSVVALGFFDGLHPGHQAVIRPAVELARRQGLTPCVFTFFMDQSHPAAKPTSGRLLSEAMRDQLLEEMGVTHVLCPPFGEFRSMTPQEYVEVLLHRILQARYVFSGENYHFGKGAAGNVSDLRRLGAGLGIEADTMPMVLVDGAPVSSTRIRACIAGGDMSGARRLLGRWFTVDFPPTSAAGGTLVQPIPAWFARPRPGLYRSGVCLPQGRSQAVTQVVPPQGESSEWVCVTTLSKPPLSLPARVVVELEERLEDAGTGS